MLQVLAPAGEEVVTPDHVQLSMRGYAASTEADVRRRTTLHRIGQRVAPTGLNVEVRNGSGFRMHGEVRISMV
jgi:hypothetical protein